MELTVTFWLLMLPSVGRLRIEYLRIYNTYTCRISKYFIKIAKQFTITVSVSNELNMANYPAYGVDDIKSRAYCSLESQENCKIMDQDVNTDSEV